MKPRTLKKRTSRALRESRKYRKRRRDRHNYQEFVLLLEEEARWMSAFMGTVDRLRAKGVDCRLYFGG